MDGKNTALKLSLVAHTVTLLVFIWWGIPVEYILAYTFGIIAGICIEKWPWN